MDEGPFKHMKDLIMMILKYHIMLVSLQKRRNKTFENIHTCGWVVMDKGRNLINTIKMFDCLIDVMRSHELHLHEVGTSQLTCI